MTDSGELFSKRTNKFLKQHLSTSGYLTVATKVEGKDICFRVHRLVAEAFIPNPYNKPEVNHIDGNKTNNYVTNLEWCTSKENIAHAVDSGLLVGRRGVDNCNAKLTLEQVKEIKRLYKPYSREFGTRALAKKYGVHHMQISRIVNNKSYQEYWNCS